MEAQNNQLIFKMFFVQVFVKEICNVLAISRKNWQCTVITKIVSEVSKQSDCRFNNFEKSMSTET